MAGVEILEIKAGLQMLKPVAEVFEAVVDPDKMSGYFIAKGSARMTTGAVVTWSFPEMDFSFPVQVQKVELNSSVSFAWGDVDGTETSVEILFTPMAADRTFVSISEKSKPNDEAGIGWLRRNTEGWANFLACLKAYLEYGINLRKGAFIPEQMPV